MAKVMLVEDDNNLREIYEARLQAEGYTIISAKDGEEALVLAKAEKPDLIISDIMMPKISGFEMLDILRNTEGLKEVKVIMLTALGQNDDQQRADRLGANRYLVKSQVTLEDIVKAAHQLLSDEAAPPTAAPEPPSVTPSPTPPTPAAATVAPIPVATAPAAAEPEQPAVVTTVASSSLSAAPSTDLSAAADDIASGQPASTPTAADQGVGSSAQSTVQEEASVDSRIEDFVAGATEEPTLPITPTKPDDAPSASAEPGPSADPIPPVTPIPSTPTVTATPANDSDNAVNDDKLVSDAAQTLVASTENAASPEPEIAVAEAPATTESKAPTNPDDKDASTGSVPIAHKKVITPLDTQPKKDLDVLLAIEAANEAGSGTTQPAPVISTNDLGIQPPAPQVSAATTLTGEAPTTSTTEASTSTSPPTDTPSSNNPLDPNNIAL